MPYVSILAYPGSDLLRVAATDQPVVIAQPVSSDGTFGDRPHVVVFQREVPDTTPLLDRLHATLASSRADPDAEVFACPVPQAVRAIEVAVAQLWPPHRVQCPSCQHSFVAQHKESRRMYLACPHCHNSLLNPGWDSA
jgi:hypothetical protein